MSAAVPTYVHLPTHTALHCDVCCSAILLYTQPEYSRYHKPLPLYPYPGTKSAYSVIYFAASEETLQLTHGDVIAVSGKLRPFAYDVINSGRDNKYQTLAKKLNDETLL